MDRQLTTAVILENHPVVTDGVRGWCEDATPPISIIDAGTNLNHAWTGPGGSADVVIFDLCMRVEGTPEFGELDKLVRHGRNVVVFSGKTAPEMVLRCTRMGAKAFITKDEGKQHLIPAIRAAAKGGHYTAPEHSGIMASDRSPQRPNFTHREMEVMITWCTGASIPQVARRLNISQSSVRSYLARAQGRYADTGRYAGRKIHMLARLIEDEHLKTSDVGAPDGDL